MLTNKFKYSAAITSTKSTLVKTGIQNAASAFRNQRDFNSKPIIDPNTFAQTMRPRAILKRVPSNQSYKTQCSLLSQCRSFSSQNTRNLGQKASTNRSMSPGSRQKTDKSLDQQQKRDFKSSVTLCTDSSDAQNTLTEGTNIWLPKTCGFIGGGCMADALLGGFLQKRAFLNKNVVVTDISQERLDFMEGKYGVKTTTCNTALLSEIKIIMLAVKPQVMDEVLKEIAPQITDEHLLVSIAAGYTISSMENHLGTDKRLVRVMPNTPSQIGAGASGFSLGQSATENDANSVELLLNSVGVACQVNENQLDAVTGVSGCGPAYIYLLIEAMADGGVKMGLSREIALKLATQTVMGSAKMVQETGEHPGVLKDKVMSPGGATAAAVHKLEENGFRNSAISAVEASTLRSIELSRK